MSQDLPFPELEPKNLVLFKENITKQEIAEKAAYTVEAVNEGHVNAIEVYTQVRAVKEVTDAILKGIKDATLDEVERLNPMERSFRGIEMQLAQGRTKYDFSHDEKWCEISDKIEELKAQLKEREKLMVNALDYSGVADENGEVIQPATVVGGTEKSLKIIIPR